jgi:hypothetical protein
MPLTLTKEDGTNVTGANTFVTLAEAETFFEGEFDKADWVAATDANKEIALVTAARILDQQFMWRGKRTTPGTQPMQWPRTGVQEADRHVENNEIPTPLKEAQALIALSILTNTAFETRDPGAGGADQISAIDLGQGALKIAYQGQSAAGATSMKYKTVVKARVQTMLEPYGSFAHGGSMVKLYRG